MLATTLSSLNGIPSFLAYFAVAMVLVLIFVRIYTWVTPQDELALIKANNAAAALAFGGGGVKGLVLWVPSPFPLLKLPRAEGVVRLWS